MSPFLAFIYSKPIQILLTPSPRPSLDLTLYKSSHWYTCSSIPEATVYKHMEFLSDKSDKAIPRKLEFDKLEESFSSDWHEPYIHTFHRYRYGIGWSCRRIDLVWIGHNRVLSNSHIPFLPYGDHRCNIGLREVDGLALQLGHGLGNLFCHWPFLIL